MGYVDFSFFLFPENSGILQIQTSEASPPPVPRRAGARDGQTDQLKMIAIRYAWGGAMPASGSERYWMLEMNEKNSLFHPASRNQYPESVQISSSTQRPALLNGVPYGEFNRASI